jgi:chaperonin GroEL (HSP60 family)
MKAKVATIFLVLIISTVVNSFVPFCPSTRFARPSSSSFALSAIKVRSFDRLINGGAKQIDRQLSFNSGFLSSFFKTNAYNCLIHNPKILVLESSLKEITPLVPLIEKLIIQNDTALVIIAGGDGVLDQALTALILNKLRGALRVVCVNGPHNQHHNNQLQGDKVSFPSSSPSSSKIRVDDLRAIAIATGGSTHFTSNEGIGTPLEQVTPEMLGRAEKVVVGKEYTTIIITNDGLLNKG